MTDVDDRLRGQASKARRLAEGVSDSQPRLALTASADEAEAQAGAVEANNADRRHTEGQAADDDGRDVPDVRLRRRVIGPDLGWIHPLANHRCSAGHGRRGVRPGARISIHCRFPGRRRDAAFGNEFRNLDVAQDRSWKP